MKKILYFIAAGALLFSACKKGTLVENTVYEKLAPADTKYAYVKILNLTPSSPVLTYFMDGTKFSAGLSSSGKETAGYAYNGLYPDLGYASVTPGAHALAGKIVAGASVDGGLEVLTSSVTLEGGKYYTVFTTGTYSTVDKKIASSVVFQDVSPTLDTSKIYVRLAHFYNGTGNLDMVKDAATGTKIVSSVAYGTVSDWMEIPNPGQGTAPSNKLYINKAGTTTPLIAAGTTVGLTKGRAYTIYLRGITGSSSFPLSATYYTTFY